MRIRFLHQALILVAAGGLLPTLGMAFDEPAGERTESLIENLHAEHVDVRRAAATKVRLSPRAVQRKALPVMIDLLAKEKDGQVRLAVLDTLTALGQDAVSAVPALVHTLRTDFGGQGTEALHQDYRAALALAAIGKPSVESLRELLKERKESVRAEAVMALGRIGPDAEPAVPDLIPLLADKNKRIQQEAALALGHIGEASIQPLIAASSHKDALTRSRAVESLGHLSVPDDRVTADCPRGSCRIPPPTFAFRR